MSKKSRFWNPQMKISYGCIYQIPSLIPYPKLNTLPTLTTKNKTIIYIMCVICFFSLSVFTHAIHCYNSFVPQSCTFKCVETLKQIKWWKLGILISQQSGTSKKKFHSDVFQFFFFSNHSHWANDSDPVKIGLGFHVNAPFKRN